MKLDITDTHFIELQKKGITIDIVVMLGWVNKELPIDHILKGSKKVETIYKAMIRKNLVSEEGKITVLGTDILEFVSKKTNKKFEKRKQPESEFDEWWQIFPSNDKFEIKGKSFGPTRSFKQDKEGCRLLFNSMITNKEFTKEEIIDATLFDVNLKKERSFKSGENKLKFLRNSATYLRRKDFQGFVGMGKPKEIKKTTRLGSVDI
jgi:hypothetical protein